MIEHKRILIVEDEPANRQLYAEVLTRAGYTVQTAKDWSEALKAHRIFKPHLIILDLNLGEGPSGFHVLADIRSVNQRVGILILSAFGTEEHFVKASDLDADNFIVKPVSEKTLLARVRMQLRLERDAGLGLELPTTTVAFQDFSIDFTTRCLTTSDGRTHALTEHQLRIVAALLRHPGAVTPHDELLRQVYHAELVTSSTRNDRRHVLQAVQRLKGRFREAVRRNVVELVPHHGFKIEAPVGDSQCDG